MAARRDRLSALAYAAGVLWLEGFPLFRLNPDAATVSDPALMSLISSIPGLLLLLLAIWKARRGAPGAASAWGCMALAFLVVVGLLSLTALRMSDFVGNQSYCDAISGNCFSPSWRTVLLPLLPPVCFSLAAPVLFRFVRRCGQEGDAQRTATALTPSER